MCQQDEKVQVRDVDVRPTCSYNNHSGATTQQIIYNKSTCTPSTCSLIRIHRINFPYIYLSICHNRTCRGLWHVCGVPAVVRDLPVCDAQLTSGPEPPFTPILKIAALRIPHHTVFLRPLPFNPPLDSWTQLTLSSPTSHIQLIYAHSTRSGGHLV
jgi:hypothetical protein